MADPTPRNSDDLSLEDFTSQVNIIRQLIRAAISGTMQLIKRSWWIMLVLAVLFGGAGFALKSTSGVTYSASMTVAFKYLTKKMYADMMGKLNAQATNGNYEVLAARLGISQEEAQNVRSISTFNLPGEPLSQDLANDRVPFTIAVKVNDPAVLPALEAGLIHYMESTPFVQEELELQRSWLSSQQAHFSAQKAWIDSIKVLFEQSLTGVPTTVPLSLSELMDQSNTLFSKLEEVRRQSAQTKNILVMDSFVAASPVGGKDGKGSWGFLGAIVGLLLGFAVAFVRGPAN